MILWPLVDSVGYHRWRKGGGINVPIIVTFSTRWAEALHVKERVRQSGTVVTLSRDDGNCFTEAATTKSLTILLEPTRKLADTCGVIGEIVCLSWMEREIYNSRSVMTEDHRFISERLPAIIAAESKRAKQEEKEKHKKIAKIKPLGILKIWLLYYYAKYLWR